MAILNFEADQAIFDNKEQQVTYTSVATSGNTTASISDAGFYRTGQGLAEGAPSQGVYVKATARFTIRNSLLSGFGGAKPSDTITRQDGSIWTVLSALPPVISGVWQIDTIDLILSNGLKQLGTLTRPSNAEKDSAGRKRLKTYSTIAANVPCRVQPITGDANDVMDRRAVTRQFTAFLGQQIVPQANDQFTVGQQKYTILDFRNPQRIDELMTLRLELIDQSGTTPTPPSSGPNWFGGSWFGAGWFGEQWWG